MESATLVQNTGTDVGALLLEIQQYLAVVGAFRDEGCEPRYEDDEPLARLLSGCYPGM